MNKMAVASATYPLVENLEQASAGQTMALVALSHTAVEHRLYSAMLTEISIFTLRIT